MQSPAICNPGYHVNGLVPQSRGYADFLASWPCIDSSAAAWTCNLSASSSTICNEKQSMSRRPSKQMHARPCMCAFDSQEQYPSIFSVVATWSCAICNQANHVNEVISQSRKYRRILASRACMDSSGATYICSFSGLQTAMNNMFNQHMKRMQACRFCNVDCAERGCL